MSDHFDQVKEYVLELDLQIEEEIAAEEILVVNDHERGIQNLVIDCEDEVLVLEQLILKLEPGAGVQECRRILQINRELVYGAFVLDEEGDTLIYRNTLALENLDLNELDSTINALSLGLAENGAELLAFAQK